MTLLRGARPVAAEALLAIERRGLPADETLETLVRQAKLDARDRGLAVELVYGVLRRRAALDWRLDRIADRPMQRLPLAVATALRLGAYQLLFLDRIPSSAAVNESVALVKTLPQRAGGRPWDGFVNAVLRNLLREPAPPFPDPAQDPVAALAVSGSCPAWLVERWLARHGPAQAALLCQATLAIPPLTLRANALRGSREALMDDLRRGGYDVAATLVSPAGLVLEKCGSVTDIPTFDQGRFYVEDEAAQLVALLVDPQPGELVLDACAAPGGKSTHLAALMQNQGAILALDQSESRLQRLQDNGRRLGVSILRASLADATDRRQVQALAARRPVDRVLLDAPCSGLGVLRRHPEGKWQKTSAALSQHQERQRRLLESVSAVLRPGGTMVYSTCSTEPEENEDVIEDFLRQHAEFERVSVADRLPVSGRSLVTARGDFSTQLNAYSMDGFFAARLRRNGGR